MLIDAGANINVQGDEGDTPLHMAAYYGEIKIARMLIDAGADETILDNDGLRWEDIINWDDEWNEDEE